jgi:hypothetical protein
MSACARSDSQEAGYAAVLHLRSATRVLQLIHQQQLDPSQPAGETVSHPFPALCEGPEQFT